MNNRSKMLFTVTSGESDPARITLILKMALEAKKSGKESSLLLMLDGTNLARKKYLSGINAGIPFRPAEDKLEEFLRLGGSLYVARSCMLQKNIQDSDLVEAAQVIRIDKVLELLETNKIISL